MGVETRHDGKLYYYEKERRGDKVISRYVGGGLVVDLAEAYAQREADRKQAERERLEVTKRMMDEIDSGVDPLGEVVNLMVEAQLLASGYHRHKRQWRKRREVKA